MRASKVKRLRAFIEDLADHLEDGEALQSVELFRVWEGAAQYQIHQRVRYRGILYRCLMDHLSQDGWNPVDAPSLWARVMIEDPNTIPAWVQPDSTNPYAKGDKVRHHGKIWVSRCDLNIWEPGVYGWEEAA